jgi:predicted metal-binding membrane protein
VITATWFHLAISASDPKGAANHAFSHHIPPLRPPISIANALFQVPQWTLMVVAMMGPGVLPALHHTVANSLRWRQGRAAAYFATGYMVVWIAFGLLGSLLIQVLPAIGWHAMASALVLAAVWQRTRWKKQCVWACHKSIPLPLSGVDASIADMTFGVRNALACVGSCWSMMVAMLLAPTSHFLWTIFFTGIVTLEKVSPKPISSVRFGFFALVAATIGLVLSI